MAHLASGARPTTSTSHTNLIVDELGRARDVPRRELRRELGGGAASGAFDVRRSLGRDDAALLRGWGLNVVRLGVMWPATMPAEAEARRA